MPYEKVGKNEPVCIADEVPFEIPESWEWVRISGIFSIINGDRGKNYPAKSTLSNTGIPFISAVNLNGETVIEDDNLLCLSDEQFNKLGSGKLEKDDVVVCIRGSLGKHGRYPFEKGAIASSLVILRPHLNIPLLSDFIMMYLDSPLFFSEIKRYDNGTAQPNLSAKSLEMFFVPLPPLSEQKRIVDKLNEVSSHTDSHSETYVRVTELNQKFPGLLKKSILQEAVQGKLVPQDPADEPASDLLKRIRAEKERLIQEGKIKRDKHESVIYRRDNSHYEKRGSEEVCINDEIPFEIPKNWAWTRLKNICSLIGDIDHNMPKPVSADVGVLFLSAKDLLDDGTINYTQNVKYISRADFERLSRKALPQKHDIIYSRIGAALGKARLVEIDREFLVSYSCCVVRPLLVYAPYIRYYLESPQILLHSIKARQSIGVPDLGMGEIKKYLVALPPYNEQVCIVEQLEVLLDRCDFKK